MATLELHVNIFIDCCLQKNDGNMLLFVVFARAE